MNVAPPPPPPLIQAALPLFVKTETSSQQASQTQQAQQPPDTVQRPAPTAASFSASPYLPPSLPAVLQPPLANSSQGFACYVVPSPTPSVSYSPEPGENKASAPILAHTAAQGAAPTATPPALEASPTPTRRRDPMSIHYLTESSEPASTSTSESISVPESVSPPATVAAASPAQPALTQALPPAQTVPMQTIQSTQMVVQSPQRLVTQQTNQGYLAMPIQNMMPIQPMQNSVQPQILPPGYGFAPHPMMPAMYEDTPTAMQSAPDSSTQPGVAPGSPAQAMPTSSSASASASGTAGPSTGPSTGGAATATAGASAAAGRKLYSRRAMPDSPESDSPASPALRGHRRKRWCSICQRLFSNLATHRSTHLAADDRPHSCDECGRGFARINDLLRHKRSHTLTAPYVCPFYVEGSDTSCHMTGRFSRCDTYKNHLKSVHFAYPAGTRKADRLGTRGQCGPCGASYASSAEWLSNHVYTGKCEEICRVRRITGAHQLRQPSS